LNTIIDYIQAASGYVVDLLLWPFTELLPIWGLIAVSVISGIVLLICYGKISQQAKLKAVKRKIYAALLETILYRHDLRTCLRAQGAMLMGGVTYFLLAVPPILILALPCILLLSQLNMHFGFRPLVPGEHAIVEVAVADAEALNTVQLTGSAGVDVTEPLRVSSEKRAFWRVTIKETGDQTVALKMGDGAEALERPLAVRGVTPPLASVQSATWYERLLYPNVERLKGLPESLQLVGIRYPEPRYSIFGFRLHWVIVFLVISIVSGLIGAKVLRIEV
jgi:hypothetical protein